MSRTIISVALLGVLWAASAALAQQPTPPSAPPELSSELEPDPLTPDLYDVKDLAKAKFATAHADLRDLLRGQRAAARDVLLARFQEYVAGRGTLEMFLDLQVLLLDSERALDDTPAVRLAIAEARWAQAREAELLNEDKYRAGRLSLADWAWTRYVRLDAEIALIQARAEHKRGPPVRGHIISAGFFQDPFASQDDTAWERKFARDKFATTQSAVPELARQRIEAARDHERARAQEYLAGRGTLDILLQAARQVLDAELALSDNSTARVAAWERYWTRTKLFDLVNDEKWKQGRLSFADRMQTRYTRLDAEIGWAGARDGQANAPSSDGGKQIARPPADLLEVELSGVGTDVARGLVKAKLAAVRADVPQLKRERLEAVRAEYRARGQEFMAGRGTLDLLLEAARHLRDAELAVCRTPAERAAACERHWTRTWLIEKPNEEKYQAGRLALADFAQSRYFRLQAEIAWAAARNEQANK